jgi:serine protease Do
MKRRVWIIFSAAIIAAFLAGGWAVPQLFSASAMKPADHFTPEQRAALQDLKAFSSGFAAVAQAVSPSVVTVTSEKLVQPAANPFGGMFGNDPMFRRFFGDPGQNAQPFKQRGLGSGVIVRDDGYILTNNHVIQGADELTVELFDGRKLPAKVVGADPRSDLAVLRVDASGLPAMTIGDSEQVRIGEWVLAIGSPFNENLQHTVTAGIVSATGRSGMNLNEYEDFIQTDAAINPGNSGGALVNLDGEMIGINSAIASRTGGSNGIGFAIPANIAVDVMNDLITDGKVTRGWLGVSIQDVNQDLAQAMNLSTESGVLINSVAKGGPAEKAGLEQGDVIVRFDGKAMKNVSELRLTVAKADPNDEAQVVVLRDGKEKAVSVRLGEFPEDGSVAAVQSGEVREDDLGITVEPITPDLAQQFELQDVSKGLVVTTITGASPAEDAGLQPGDVILKVNRQSVVSLKDYRAALDQADPGSPVLFLLQRGGNTFFVAIRPKP